MAPLTAIAHAQPKLSRTPVEGVVAAEVARLVFRPQCSALQTQCAAFTSNSRTIRNNGSGWWPKTICKLLTQHRSRSMGPKLGNKRLQTGVHIETFSLFTGTNSSNSTTGRQSSPEFSAKSIQGTFRGKSYIPNMTSLSSGLWPTFLATKKTREGRPILILKLLNAFVKPKSSERRR